MVEDTDPGDCTYLHLNPESSDFPGGAVVKNLPVNAGDMAWEDPTCRGAIQPVCHNYWAHMPQLLKPAYLEPVFHKRSHRNEKPMRRNRVAPAHHN